MVLPIIRKWLFRHKAFQLLLSRKGSGVKATAEKERIYRTFPLVRLAHTLVKEEKLMTVTYTKEIPRGDENHVYVEAFADTTPSPLPTVEDIPGYEDYDQIAVGSTLYIVHTGDVYIADETGAFVAQ